ncbi:protein of unknown function (plasmid) [Agrobacterium pusense]|uniref:Uncharacterized protein n=1 Tax=Agrobacterium pusense TaxID=648995 RepID=U4Q4Q9_9HYPH|nr:protein of unknown function [Agrobacterium pusense]
MLLPGTPRNLLLVRHPEAPVARLASLNQYQVLQDRDCKRLSSVGAFVPLK